MNVYTVRRLIRLPGPPPDRPLARELSECAPEKPGANAREGAFQKEIINTREIGARGRSVLFIRGSPAPQEAIGGVGLQAYTSFSLHLHT